MRARKSMQLSVSLLAAAVVVGSVSGQQQRPNLLPGEKYTPPAMKERLPEKVKLGDPAPDFALPDPSGKKEVRLSSFKGQKPVVLVFGSCT